MAVIEVEPRAVGQRHRNAHAWAVCARGASGEGVVGRRGVALAPGCRRVAGRERLGRRLVLGARNRRRERRHDGLGEHGLGAVQRHAVLRPRRAGQAGTHGRQVELQRLGERRGRRGIEPQALLLGVRLDQRDLLGRAPGEAQVAEGLVVDREDGHGRPVLGRHVADRRPVLERDVGHSRAVELDELAHHAVRAQQLGDGEDEVGGGGALGLLTEEAEPDHLGYEHRDGLAEHGRLRLDPAHSPAEHSEPVDHGGVRVGADQRVGVGLAVTAREHHPGQVLEVDLVADPRIRRHDLQLLERALAPSEELVALGVALELQLRVAGEGVRPAVRVGDHRVVDDQLRGNQRIDPGRVAAERHDGVAHGGQIDDRRDAREVLHQDAGRGEGDLVVGLAALPPGQRLDVGGPDADAVLVAEQVLEQDLERVRKVPAVVAEAEDLIGPRSDVQVAPRPEAVKAHEAKSCRVARPVRTPATVAG